MKFRGSVICGLFVLALAVSQDGHASPGGVTGKVSCGGVSVGLSIDIAGEITVATVKSVSKLFEEYHEQRKKIASGARCDDSAAREDPPDFSAYGEHYRINSVGGSVDAAMAIGRMLRRENAWIGVNGVCFSACVFVLAGAVERHIGRSDQVGIHRPYLSSTPDQPTGTAEIKLAYSPLLQNMRNYLREMNVSQRLADDMLATEPESNRLLTRAELDAYRLTGVIPEEQQRRAIEKEASDIQEANQLGLNRLEYLRRKAFGNKTCLFTASGALANDYEYLDCLSRILKTGTR